VYDILYIIQLLVNCLLSIVIFDLMMSCEHFTLLLLSSCKCLYCGTSTGLYCLILSFSCVANGLRLQFHFCKPMLQSNNNYLSTLELFLLPYKSPFDASHWPGQQRGSRDRNAGPLGSRLIKWKRCAYIHGIPKKWSPICPEASWFKFVVCCLGWIVITLLEFVHVATYGS